MSLICHSLDSPILSGLSAYSGKLGSLGARTKVLASAGDHSLLTANRGDTQNAYMMQLQRISSRASANDRGPGLLEEQGLMV